MPAVITIANMKGGVGKSTLAFNLILSFAESLKVGAIDTDFQGSISQFLPDTENINLIPAPKDFGQLRKADNDLIIIDTPGYLSTQLPDLLLHSDIVIIPAKPGFWDFSALKPMFKLINEAEKINTTLRSYVVFTMINPHTKLNEEISSLIRDENLKIMNTQITQRVSYVRSLITGGILKSEDLKAKLEIINLAEEIINELQS